MTAARQIRTSRFAGLRLPLVLVACVAFASVQVRAASIEAAEYDRLLQSASANGFVPVLVTLDRVSLGSIQTNRGEVASAMAQKASALRRELGRSALEGGFWNNGMGQVGFYVDQAGLQVLKASAAALSFTFDASRSQRETVNGSDGSLEAVEQTLRGNASVAVEVFFASEEADYDLEATGARFKPAQAVAAEAAKRIDELAFLPYSAGMGVLDRTPPFISKPSAILSIDRSAFYGLRANPNVRAIRPAGHIDAREAVWDGEAVAIADKHGATEVVITLRGGPSFSPMGGYMSGKERGIHAAANRRALDAVLTAVSPGAQVMRDFSDIAATHVRLTAPELRRLYANRDPRILSVVANRPMGGPALANSTVLVNMPSAWNAGYRGAGQYIVVMDTGINKSHAMFQMNGATKVLFEGCYGSNTSDHIYRSICPSAQPNGDSNFNTPNAGAPQDNSECAVNIRSECSHGTHVAGIAAGRASASLNLQGVAPDAYLVSMQVFSVRISYPNMVYFNADLLAALTDTYLFGTTAAGPNSLTVNMSLDGSLYPGNCPTVDVAISNRVQDLISRGVPVVAAAGNSGSKTSMAFPACIPNITKVASVLNDASGVSLSGFSNIGNPGNFSGPILLAPGEPVTSSTVRDLNGFGGNTRTLAMSGTSQAAPHVSGLYAAIKATNPSISVADAAGWIVGTGSFPVTYSLPSPTGTQTYRRIRVPSF